MWPLRPARSTWARSMAAASRSKNALRPRSLIRSSAQTAPSGIDARNPAFDVTPAELITALITERGLIQPVTRDAIQCTLGKSKEHSRSLVGT